MKVPVSRNGEVSCRTQNHSQIAGAIAAAVKNTKAETLDATGDKVLSNFNLKQRPRMSRGLVSGKSLKRDGTDHLSVL